MMRRAGAEPMSESPAAWNRRPPRAILREGQIIELPETDALLKKEQESHVRLQEAAAKRKKSENSVIGKMKRALAMIAPGQTSGLDSARKRLDKLKAKRDQEKDEYDRWGM